MRHAQFKNAIFTQLININQKIYLNDYIYIWIG